MSTAGARYADPINMRAAASKSQAEVTTAKTDTLRLTLDAQINDCINPNYELPCPP